MYTYVNHKKTIYIFTRKVRKTIIKFSSPFVNMASLNVAFTMQRPWFYGKKV